MSYSFNSPPGGPKVSDTDRRRRAMRAILAGARALATLGGCSGNASTSDRAAPAASVASVTAAPSAGAPAPSAPPSAPVQTTASRKATSIRAWGSTLQQFRSAFAEDPKTIPGSAFEPTKGLGPADGSETDRYYGLSFGDAGGVTSTMEQRFPRGTDQAAAISMAEASLPRDSKLLWQAFNKAGQCYITEFVSTRLKAEGYDHGAVRIEYDSVDFTRDPAKNYVAADVTSADFEPVYDPTAAEQAAQGCED